jgi:hypothetical protein
MAECQPSLGAISAFRLSFSGAPMVVGRRRQNQNQECSASTSPLARLSSAE